MSYNQHLITFQGFNCVIRPREAEQGRLSSVALGAGDQSATESIGFRSVPLECWDRYRPPISESRLNYDGYGWTWTVESWGKRLTHRSELDGAMLWAGMGWRGGRIGSVEWPPFPQSGTLIRAFVMGIDRPQLRDMARDPKNWSKLVAANSAWELSEEFYQWRLKHDPEKTPDRSVSRGREDDSQCSVIIPIAEIEKTLIPVPESILAMIRK